MQIELKQIKIREVVRDYSDTAEGGVRGYGGKLNIRPAYQREFIYKDKERNAVIRTINNGFPLNVMYWVDNGDGTYEVLDGQQRTISFCQYVNNDFSIDDRGFVNLKESEQDRILDYDLMIYICQGDEREQLDWFRTINIPGAQLTDQELRNAIYSGPWVSDAKKYFSKPGAAAASIGSRYLNGSAIRQDYLETAIRWLAQTKGQSIEGYMSAHQHDPSANPLWLYFKSVIDWVEATFPTYRKEMKHVDWGTLYNDHKDDELDPFELEEKVAELMIDDEVTYKKGIYAYLLTKDPRSLNLRQFSEQQKRQIFERQKGICPMCVQEHRPRTVYTIEEMEADHITPWVDGGQTVMDNCQMLCRDHNRRKGSNRGSSDGFTR